MWTPIVDMFDIDENGLVSYTLEENEIEVELEDK